MSKKAAFSGLGGKIMSDPASAITALVLIYVGLQFLSSALATGGIVDTAFNSIEAILNTTGFTGLSAIFNTGGAVYLLLGVGVIAGAIYFVKGGNK